MMNCKNARALIYSIFLLPCILLADCSGSYQAVSEVEAPAKTAVCTPTIAKNSIKPTAQALPPEDFLKYRPLEVSSNIPSGIQPPGALLLNGDVPQLLHFSPQLRAEEVTGINSSCLSTSPDGKWFLYCPSEDNSQGYRSMIVVSADRSQKNKVMLDSRILYLGGSHLWSGNKFLQFPVPQKDYGKASPMMFIDPFTGDTKQIESNYPNVMTPLGGPTGRMYFNYSSVVYDPTLRFVIYPEWDGLNYTIVLWDRQTNSIVSKIDNTWESGHYPIWSPDGKQVAKGAIFNFEKDRKNIEEWYLADQKGQVNRLTLFGDYFQTSKIGYEASWSPDGKKLAFWLETFPTKCTGDNLAILEIATQQVTNTCLPGRREFSSAPLWSFDSRYVALTDTNEKQTDLVDVDQWQAFKISDNSFPVGWLELP